MSDAPDDVSIRPATPADAASIRAVGRAAWHAAYDDILSARTVDETVDEWWGLPGLRRAAERETDVLLVAAVPDAGADSIVGVAHAHPGRGDADTSELGRLYVHPDRWGEGIGSALLDAVRDRLPDATDRLRLAVLTENDVGVSFYESYGFDRVDRRPAGLDGDHEEYVYELAL